MTQKSSTVHEEHQGMDLKKIYAERGMTGVVEALQVILPLLEEYLPQIIAFLEAHQPKATQREKEHGTGTTNR